MKRASNGMSVTLYIKSVHSHEWNNFGERVGNSVANADDMWNDPDKELELRLWASNRGQTLARCIRGMLPAAGSAPGDPRRTFIRGGKPCQGKSSVWWSHARFTGATSSRTKKRLQMRNATAKWGAAPLTTQRIFLASTQSTLSSRCSRT
eukprot:23682_4